ncbi:conserved hypothetical protein [Hyella patelloides LEGE 07179]|uniref:Lipid-A-disaccharide synthase n=1 Tax=Hyella patelloides LEGE 07179 TaxID=945734 RepID=A0A563VRB8_9CYAN|nr:lipid-A-disaccharide synthase-related protein [Hyella patelloides]VEP13925.1 conserved hypothetical protein [Hyella patelloides LEGE 07179]
MKLLIVSNGHGEDIIAVRIIEQLQISLNNLEITALPIVGEGYAYKKLHIPIAGKVQIMPSGGFVYMSKNHLFSDIQGGLLQLTVEQLKVVKQWGKTQYPIVAVGDIVPLLFARLSGSNYAFVGTAKSEYYLRDSHGTWLEQTSWLEKQFGSVYLPWERWLMSGAISVYPRDTLTTTILQQQGIKAHNLGNPMMDGFAVSSTSERLDRTLKIVLLPGSRQKEALRNWQQILAAVSEIVNNLTEYELIFYAAIAPTVDITLFQQLLLANGWKQSSSEKLLFEQRKATLWLAQNAYNQYLQEAHLAIAMAGTATEQFVGLGKPVITMPGEGPQCTFAFMEAQSRLLGCSILLQESPTEVVPTIKSLLNAPDWLKAIAKNGRARMGNPGAAQRIAHHLKTTLLQKSS